MSIMKSVVVFLSVCIGAALAYSPGAPVAACPNLTPQHGVDPQQSSPPYSLSVSSLLVRAGDTVNVTLKGDGPADTIKGFLFQARQITKPKGQFKVVDSNSQLLNCLTESVSNSITANFSFNIILF